MEKNIEQELDRIENQVNYFFKLVRNGIESAKNEMDDEVPTVFINEDMSELTLYDKEKNMVYNAQIKEIIDVTSNEKNGYTIDVANLLKEYILKSIVLLRNIDKRRDNNDK